MSDHGRNLAVRSDKKRLRQGDVWCVVRRWCTTGPLFTGSGSGAQSRSGARMLRSLAGWGHTFTSVGSGSQKCMHFRVQALSFEARKGWIFWRIQERKCKAGINWVLMNTLFIFCLSLFGQWYRNNNVILMETIVFNRRLIRFNTYNITDFAEN